MFTGIITHIGVVEQIKFDAKKDCALTISVTQKIARTLDIGCSVACNGICLTLVKKENILLSKNPELIKNLPAKKNALSAKLPENSLAEKSETKLFFQASKETCNATNLTKWAVGTAVNLEFALRVGDEFGGHIVSGHVDGCAQLKAKTAIQDSVQLEFQLEKKSAALKKFIATKGSICLDGISLTVNKVKDDKFFVNLIPHSLANTTFSTIKIGDLVNVEIDLIARYVLKD